MNNDVTIKAIAVDNPFTINYAVIAIRNGVVIDRIDGIIDKKIAGSGNLKADMSKLKKKYNNNHHS